ncbi:DUF4367 domain-containing protein [Priestia abyssalis]|uniref:DUF4367 domain-containing protein n=1 Tax=Priestia abyssalis TaxID=1221450 RepID=UPI0009954FE1|nr:DUF4367 domain-containing protein [Priestia abyssalis]
MNVSVKLILGLLLIVNLILGIEANLVQAIKYNHNSITIPELKKKVDFKVLTPKEIPSHWTLDIKTYPWGEKEDITDFRLHYMDKYDEHLMFGIGERKASGRLEKPEYSGKTVNINGYKGYFSPFKASRRNEHPIGGILCWVQNDTYLEMDSSTLTKNEMINIAESME